MEHLGARRDRRRVRRIDVGARLHREGDVVQARRVELELLLLERLAQAERARPGAREAQVVDLLAALAGKSTGSSSPSGPSTAR